MTYTSVTIFEPSLFIHNLKTEIENKSEKIFKEYKEFHKSLISKIKLVLTRTYNLFHIKGLSINQIVKESKQSSEVCKELYQEVIKIRELNKEMDKTIF